MKGSFYYNSEQIDFVQTASGYKYTWNSEQKYAEYVPIFIIDLSYSIEHHFQIVLKSLIECCEKIFEDSITQIHLIFFGNNSIYRLVDINTYKLKINEMIDKYSTKINILNRINDINTDPKFAFQIVTQILPTISPGKLINIIFITDGSFNDALHTAYINELKNVYPAHKIFINMIGYKNDKLKNIKNTCTEFSKNHINHIYYSADDKSNIISIYDNIFGEFKNILRGIKILKINNLLLKTQTPIYSAEKIFDMAVAKYDTNYEIDIANKYDVTAEWIDQVHDTEISIGLKEAYLIVNLIYNKEQIFNQVIDFSSEIQHKYLSLRNEVRYVKEKNIDCWNNLTAKIINFFRLLKDIQDLISNKISGKKEYELITKISHHTDQLHHFKLFDQINTYDNFNIQIISKLPLILQNNANEPVQLTCALADLNKNYVCMYTQNKWSDSLNTLTGISVKYDWKENDINTPSQSFIEKNNTLNYMSYEGYREARQIFGDLNHIKLNKKIIKNIFIPIATDPFFLDKINLVKEIIGSILTKNSTLPVEPCTGFIDHHILLYCSVISHCFKELYNIASYKLESSSVSNNNTISTILAQSPSIKKQVEILIMLLNTFKILSDNIPFIFTKDLNPMCKINALLNIAEGNTSTNFISSYFDGIIIVLTSNELEISNARDKYNNKYTKNLNKYEFSKHLLKMLLRHCIIHIFCSNENLGCFYNKKETSNKSWEDSTIWNFESENIIFKNLKEEGVGIIDKYLMTAEKHDIKNLPNFIRQKIQYVRNSEKIGLTLFAFNFFGNINYNALNQSFLINDDMMDFLNHPIDISYTELELNELIYWTRWEFLHCGKQKDCPYIERTELVEYIVNQINLSHSEQLAHIFADVKDFNEYNIKRYETRYLPVTFMNDEADYINNLFKEVFFKNIDLENFRSSLLNVLGPYVAHQINDVLITDNLDVIQNLYHFCETTDHELKIKPDTRLPFSCPANPSSPYFLQKLSDEDFHKYYKPIGLGCTGKKYSSWINQYHAFMLNNVNKYSQDIFVDKVFHHVKSAKLLNSDDMLRYESDIIMFYKKYHTETCERQL